MQYNTVQYNTVQYNRYSAIQYTATQYSAIQYSIACSTYSRLQYCTKLKKNIDQKSKAFG